jgi:flagellar biosynthesis GTPase FlhF
LISELFAKKDTLGFEDTLSFYDAWKLATTESITEKAEQEKAKQAQLARDKQAQDNAAKEKVEQEKIKQAQLARDKQAQDNAAKEKAEQEKIKQAQLARDKQAQDKAAREKADKQDQYGRYLDITVNNVIQRFRWIEAGTFLMGSPANEPERGDNEKQHSVTLSQGY